MNTVSEPYWPRLWAENPSLLREARRQSYLVLVHESGRLACKACGAFIPWEDPSKHFERHMAELDRYLASKQAIQQGQVAHRREVRKAERRAEKLRLLSDAELQAEMGL